MLRDFDLLGVKTVSELARREPEAMYEDLCKLTRAPQDICVLDVFQCAVAQAQNPDLAPEKRKWWYWSRLRKRHEASGARPVSPRTKERV